MKKRKILLLISFLLIIITFSITYGRYVYNYIHEHLLEAEGFYFNSETMNINGSSHSLNDWDGVSSYSITLDVNNRKNEYIHTKSNIEYDITYECSNNVICEISKTSGIVDSNIETDSFIISFRPKNGVTFTSKDFAVIKTSVTSTSPYVKKLYTEYIVGIKTLGFSYSINDYADSKYVELELNNSVTYYEIMEAFLDYSIGDHISNDTYQKLSDENKQKCKSAVVRISFDTNTIRINNLDNIYLLKAYDISYNNINGSDYIKQFTFNMNANSTERIRFYKLDSKADYSNSNYIINVYADIV